MIGSARQCARLYFFEDGTNLRKQDQCTCFNFVYEDSEIMVWHYRLSHPSFQYLKYLFPNFFQNKIPFFFQCKICQLSKHHCAFFFSATLQGF